MDHEQSAVEFIEAVSQREHLRREFDRIHDAADDLAKGLDLEQQRTLLANLRLYLGNMASRLEAADQRVGALLPGALAYRDRLQETASRANAVQTKQVWEDLDKSDRWSVEPAPAAGDRGRLDEVLAPREVPMPEGTLPPYTQWEAEKPSKLEFMESFDAYVMARRKHPTSGQGKAGNPVKISELQPPQESGSVPGGAASQSSSADGPPMPTDKAMLSWSEEDASEEITRVFSKPTLAGMGLPTDSQENDVDE
jgi:hypothetical protein